MIRDARDVKRVLGHPGRFPTRPGALDCFEHFPKFFFRQACPTAEGHTVVKRERVATCNHARNINKPVSFVPYFQLNHLVKPPPIARVAMRSSRLHPSVLAELGRPTSDGSSQNFQELALFQRLIVSSMFNRFR